MKKFDNLRMVLFDSTNACFRLAVEAQFTRSNPAGGYRDLVYVTDRATGMLNPNIYVTLSYKDPKTNPTPVYTSYPQLFRLREAMETVKGFVANNEGFIQGSDGTITVKTEYSEPVVLPNIGKANNWISFKLVVVQSGEEGVVTYVPGVSIELSTSNGFASALTVEEFLTVYSIINDINLSTLQCVMSLAYLDTDGVGSFGFGMQQGQMPYYQQPQPNQMPQPYYQQPQGGYQQGGYQPQSRPAPAPHYGGNGYRSAPRVAPAPAPQGQQVQGGPTMMKPNGPVAAPQPNRQMPVNNPQPAPRSGNKPTINLGAVEETPISEVSYDDSEAIDAIFNDD